MLATEQLRAWQVSPAVTERAERIVDELAADAALHGRVQGRDFRLTLTRDAACRHGTLCVEVIRDFSRSP